jgi:signal transduction histidine kinase
MEVIESPVDNDDDETTQSATAPLFSDGSGRMTAGTAYDITRQEELQTRLKREAAAHAEVLERLGTAIAIFGPDTRLVFFNTAFAELWDLSLDWLQEQPTFATLLDALRAERRLPEVADFPAYKDKELERFTSLLEPMEDILHLPGGGTLRRVVAPHPMGGLLTTYEDITDKLALERSYNTLIAVQRETIDNLQEAVAVFGGDGELRLANPAFAELWDINIETLREGPPMGEVIDAFQKHFDDLTIWARHRTVMLGALDSETQRTAQQGRVVRMDGSVLEFISVPLPDGGVLFCYNDVSAPERVAQTLRGRAEALTATDKLRTEFLTNVAVELEGPVSNIGALAKRLANIKPGQPAAVVQDIIEASATLKTLVEDVRDLSGVETGQQTLHLDSFDILDVMNRVSTMTREVVKRHGVNLEIVCEKNIGWMVGDAARIKQTLYHLLTGALKNIPDGERVVLSAQRDDLTKGDVIFAVRHAANGQTHAGLGVYLAQRTAELHGGALTTDADGVDILVACRLPAGGASSAEDAHLASP